MACHAGSALSLSPVARITLLDGPLGTELAARGVATPPPLWSAAALETHPEVVAAIHRDYAAAGAQVHVAGTFRTQRRHAGARWRTLARRAVALCREAVGPGRRVAGSLAPLEDCYRPDRSPPDPGPAHAEVAEALADAGVDLLLCETFPHVGEAVAAVGAAVATGLPTWVAFTAGPGADLLTPAAMAEGARLAIAAGAVAVLVNCTPATRTLPFVEALAVADLGVPLGAYANAGARSEGLGWGAGDDAAARYADLADAWIAAGATLVGSCCGTTPAHIAELARRHPG